MAATRLPLPALHASAAERVLWYPAAGTGRAPAPAQSSTLALPRGPTGERVLRSAGCCSASTRSAPCSLFQSCSRAARSKRFRQLFSYACFEGQHKVLLTHPPCADTGAFLLINDTIGGISLPNFSPHTESLRPKVLSITFFFLSLQAGQMYFYRR